MKPAGAGPATTLYGTDCVVARYLLLRVSRSVMVVLPVGPTGVDMEVEPVRSSALFATVTVNLIEGGKVTSPVSVAVWSGFVRPDTESERVLTYTVPFSEFAKSEAGIVIVI